MSQMKLNEVAKAIHSAHVGSKGKVKGPEAQEAAEHAEDPHGIDSLKDKMCPSCHAAVKAHLGSSEIE